MNATNTTPWDALLRTTRRAESFDRCHEAAPAPKTSLAGQTRLLLQRVGPMSAGAICMDVDIPSTSLVGPVLKHDLATGRITFVNGLYSINAAYDEELHKQINQAKSLLQRNGYAVKKQP